mmetsp:Transcript_52657/g.59780  ORF Transcript_52657/g.59780 Transcript_52657/m.59780 type:complete len:124 (+) Transcript_52657:155-526(+)
MVEEAPRTASTFIDISVAAPPISAGEKARALLRRVGRSDNAPDASGPTGPCEREDNDCTCACEGSCCCCCCAFLVKVVLAGGALRLLKANALVENMLKIPGIRKIIMRKVCCYCYREGMVSTL